ncbi:hypothetical protein [Methylobacillus glycogenes]|uniref:hypothetical protein n=1 Tax=Methylobacillus glycogenes TaxID=406 RepID=UPI0011DD0B18|nr:hypothetical protein [Methylobacillus glycogenes]
MDTGMHASFDLVLIENGKYLVQSHHGIWFGFVTDEPCNFAVGARLSGSFQQPGTFCITSQNGEQVQARVKLSHATQAEGVLWLYSS